MQLQAHHGARVTVELVAGILLCCSTSLAQNQPLPSPDKKASEVFKNVQVLKDVPSDQLLPGMQFITSSLGVQCEYCHAENAFDKDDKKPKQTARKMMQMMFAINSNNFEGQQKVTCYSCHRGSPKPLAIPLIGEAAARLLNEAAPAEEPNTPDLPKADEIVQKYVAALGGAAAISKLQSVTESGAFHAGPRQFPVEVLKKSPDRVVTVTHWPNGDSITAFDGKSGWIAFPGRPLRPMNTTDIDASRMDADLHFPLNIAKIFTELRLEKPAKIGDKNTLVIAGQRPGQPPVEMYFDEQSGLLVRIVRYAESPLGRNPTQIDYSDYRDVGGVKMPFLWTSATPTGRFTVQIESALPNTPIPDDRFRKPAAPAGPTPGSQ